MCISSDAHYAPRTQEAVSRSVAAMKSVSRQEDNFFERMKHLESQGDFTSALPTSIVMPWIAMIWIAS